VTTNFIFATAIRFLEYVKNHKLANCHVTVCDINDDMLEECKIKSANYDSSLIRWVKADGVNAPFENDLFNAYSISFGLRCCSDIDQMLKEAYRILQSGGKFVCMDFSKADNKLAQGLVPQ
jgi:ubiquinone/menaquinone biosynthesis C-methylase UbiE